MKKITHSQRAWSAGLLSALSLFGPMPSLAAAPSDETLSEACKLPKLPASTQEETAWRLFVAAHCPVNTATGAKLNWETWTEQTCWLQPSAPGCKSGEEKKRFSHAVSLLATRGHVAQTNSGSGLPGCQQMTTVGTQTPKSLQPFVPGNLSANPQFCEEVYVNPAEAAFITAPPGAPARVNLTTRSGQAAYLSATSKPLNMPSEAVEVKADWIAASSLNAASFFNCSDKKPAGVYVQQIDGACYALVGVHISSKLYPNWIWATFEPQSTVTNPNRCKPTLYSACLDPWGSNPANSNGKPTLATKNLTALMDQAGLAPEFRNYRLVGTQTRYEQPLASKGKLGNSFVEFNAQVLPQQASCITCHGYAAINVALNPPGTGNGGPIGNGPFIGKPVYPPITPGSHLEPTDFSWMLGFMPGK